MLCLFWVFTLVNSSRVEDSVHRCNRIFNILGPNWILRRSYSIHNLDCFFFLIYDWQLKSYSENATSRVALSWSNPYKLQKFTICNPLNLIALVRKYSNQELLTVIWCWKFVGVLILGLIFRNFFLSSFPFLFVGMGLVPATQQGY